MVPRSQTDESDKPDRRFIGCGWSRRLRGVSPLQHSTYRNIPRRIIAEKNIQPKDSYLLDYKFHVFDGEPKIIQVIGDRDFISHTRKEIFLDINWQPQNLMYHTYDNFETIPKKPDNLDEMLGIAKVLGEEFKYVRVDLYDIEGKKFFGELTFTPDSGYGKWGIERDGLLFGSWIK